MNQILTSHYQQRVPAQPHLKIFREERYDGFPVLQQPGGLIESYLERLSKIINKAIRNHRRVFVSRVDLHYPQYFHPIDGGGLSNQCFHAFIKVLTRRLEAYKIDKQKLGFRVHNVDFDYVWAREYSSHNVRPHYHLLLLFNGYTLGHFSSAHESLYNRIAESWSEALGCHVSEGKAHLHIPEDSQYELQWGNLEQYSKIFHRASYLTKVESKNFHDGYHVFGGSR